MTLSLIENHAVMLRDKVRMDAYRAAITKMVKKGDVVVDIGAGLGILSFMAIKAGAKKVYAIEADPLTISLARTIAKDNKLENKVIFIEGVSGFTKLPEKVDGIITETLGPLGLDENILPVIADAKKRFLKKGGYVIPESIKIFAAPVENKVWDETNRALLNIEGFKFISDDTNFALGFTRAIVARGDLLATPGESREMSIDLINTFEVTRDGNLSGFAVWFDATLCDGVHIDTSPDSTLTHWEQGFLPLRTITKVKKGSHIDLHLVIEPDGSPPGPTSQISYNYDVY